MIIDIHSHFLPGIDDGSQNVGMSKEMLERSRLMGVDLCVATPHFYGARQRLSTFLSNREAAYVSLKDAMTEAGRYPEIMLGAQVAFFEGISRVSELPELCIQETDCLLLEMPFHRWTQYDLSQVETLCKRYHVILAHLERYLRIEGNAGGVKDIQQLPVTVQVNAESLAGFYTRFQVSHHLRHDFILGTDMHNTTSRPPCMDKGRARIPADRLADMDSQMQSLLGR